MAKKAKKRMNSGSASASASSSSIRPSKPVSNRKMVLRIKSTVNTKKSTVTATERQKRTKSANKNVKKKINKIDAKKPKKPPTAFFYFLEDFRKEFQEQNPEVKSMRDIGKACGEKWKTMTYEEKVKYYDVATEKRAEFDKAMAEYIKRKENGEDEDDEEAEDDSDFFD